MPPKTEKEKELFAWLVFAQAGTFSLNIPVNENYVLPTLASGDALLFADREKQVATGIRRLYLIRSEAERTILYFDRIVDFASPVPLDKIQFVLPDAPAIVWKLELPKLEQALHLANQPEFKHLPELSAYDPACQSFVRDMLQQAVVSDLLGPACGSEEEIVGMSVRDRYLVGRLAPRIPCDKKDAIKDNPFTNDGEDAPDDLVVAANENHTPQAKSASVAKDEEEEDAIDATNNQSLVPSSFGFTFCMDGTLPEIEVIATWGRYERTESEFAINPKNGNPARCWKRIPSGGSLKLKLSEGRIAPKSIDASCERVFIQGSVSRQLSNSSRMVTLFLVNDQELPEVNQDTTWIFQPEIRVKSPLGNAIFMRRPLWDVEESDEELQALNMIYRKQVEFAVGHGVAVHAIASSEDYEKATEIYTVVLPQYEIPVTETPGINPQDRPAMQKLRQEGFLDMRKLAQLPVDEPIAALAILTDDYGVLELVCSWRCK